VTLRDLELRVMEARETFSEFTVIPERSIPGDLVGKARAIFIFPGTVKGGFLFALKYGQGLVLVRNAEGRWSPPAFVRLSGGSFGFQIGANWTDLILIAKQETAVQALFDNRFTLGGNLAVAFGPWGRHSEIGTDWQLKTAVFAYSRTKGLFAAMSTDGSVISFDEEANRLYYGPNLTAYDILYQSRVKLTPEAEELRDAITRHGAPDFARRAKKVIDVLKK
jgi:lipid-binding SYLF domain-containing protein